MYIYFTLDTESTISMVRALLPYDATVTEFIKYRRLLKKDKSFQKPYDTALAKLQTVISRTHRQLSEKKDKDTSHLIKIAENWNLYYFSKVYGPIFKLLVRRGQIFYRFKNRKFCSFSMHYYRPTYYSLEHCC